MMHSAKHRRRRCVISTAGRDLTIFARFLLAVLVEDSLKETPEKRLFYPLANVLFLSSRPKGEISPLYDKQTQCTFEMEMEYDSNATKWIDFLSIK